MVRKPANELFCKLMIGKNSQTVKKWSSEGGKEGGREEERREGKKEGRKSFN